MTLYVDEDLPRHLAQGFQTLLQPEALKTGVDIAIAYIPQAFEYGIKDVNWIPKVGAQGGCVLTQDIKMRRRKHEYELYRKHKVGMFFLRGKSKKQGLTVWEMVEILAKQWPDIQEVLLHAERPFEYEVAKRGVKRL